MRTSYVPLLLYLLATLQLGVGLCPSACNWNGNCTSAGLCSCFSGWEGNDCGTRSCPKGYSFADVAYSKDLAHVLEECSGRGVCERETGSCICEAGWSGGNCGKSFCQNSCSGRGQCLSLSDAASDAYNDGYLFNHTTTYTMWDANMFWGCKCDSGYAGADCSQRVCESGIDPRRSSTSPRELVTLVCKRTSTTLGGKFKLRFLGQATKSWLYPTSRAWEVAKALTVTYGNTSLHSFQPVTAYNRTVDDAVCATNVGEQRKTRILFRRSPGDLPQVGFYANLISGASMYFETKQILSCDCTSRACNGTFRVSFDGEMSSRIKAYANATTVITAIKAMATVKSAGIFDVYPAKNLTLLEYSTPICRVGVVTNHTYMFAAQTGNIPRIGLWTSVVGYKSPSSYNSINATSILAFKTNDGRDDNVKLCNGIGKCDFTTGNCQCPPGFGLDPDLGPCAKQLPATSKFNGVGRCPGYLSLDTNTFEVSSTENTPSYTPRVYLSQNPTSNATTQLSSIAFFEWNSSPTEFWSFGIGNANRVFMFYMTSDASAGPLVLDQAKERLIFVDANYKWPSTPFIGMVQVNSSFNSSSSKPYSIWVRPKCQIFGMAFDAKFNERILYWTCPGDRDKADGGVYYAYVDDTTGAIYNLGSAISTYTFPDPMGIAFNYLDSKVYWLDKSAASTTSLNVINSCMTDGTSFSQKFLPTTVGGHTLSRYLADLVIDIEGNNTAILIDASTTSPAVIGITLTTNRVNNVTQDDNADLYENMASRVITDPTNTFGAPQYLAIDKTHDIVMWADSALRTVSFAPLTTRDVASFNNTVLYTGELPDELPELADLYAQQPARPVGILIDYGLGGIPVNGYLECYGNGRCLGASGNFECQCHDGYFGDCQARSCPKGRAWFHQPFVDNIAHDVIVECSNAGTCNRETGVCACKSGYEGAACERLMCAGQTESVHYCGGNGRCLSMRELAQKHKTPYLDESTTVTYGSTPHSASTWDADMIFGCHGDEYGYYPGTASNITSFKGYKSHLHECPSGLDSRVLKGNTYHNEVQQFTCAASGGTFKVGFRGFTSAAISYAATTNAFILALTAMPAIGNVSITMSSSSTVANQICASGGNSGDISFVTERGLTPLLSVTSNGLTLNSGTSKGYMTFDRLVSGMPGNGTLLECSGHGDCDRGSGECRCYETYGSSDGAGSIGTRGDCGRSIQS